MSLADIYIIWKIYKGIKKHFIYTKYHNQSDRNLFYKRIKNVIHISVIIIIIWILVKGIYKLFANSIWNMKWFIDLSGESLPLIIYVTLIILLKPTSKELKESSYSNELEISHNESSSTRQEDFN
jgi:hypothetical protein